MSENHCKGCFWVYCRSNVVSQDLPGEEAGKPVSVLNSLTLTPEDEMIRISTVSTKCLVLPQFSPYMSNVDIVSLFPFNRQIRFVYIPVSSENIPVRINHEHRADPRTMVKTVLYCRLLLSLDSGLGLLRACVFSWYRSRNGMMSSQKES